MIKGAASEMAAGASDSGLLIGLLAPQPKPTAINDKEKSEDCSGVIAQVFIELKTSRQNVASENFAQDPVLPPETHASYVQSRRSISICYTPESASAVIETTNKRLAAFDRRLRHE